jgi:hypothetical protein
VPSSAPPSWNVTVPVGVPVPVELAFAVKVTAVPKMDGLSDETTVVVLAAKFTVTVCVSTGDVLAAKFVSPPYTAVIESAPLASPAVVSVAVPPVIVPVPSMAPPSWNVTVPVGVPVADDFTVAVSVTAVPKMDGLFEEATIVELAALFTVCVRIADVLAAKFVSPPYTAVIECAPPASPSGVSVAVAPLNVPVPKVAPPSWNVTVPVGAPAADDFTVAVSVTAVPKMDGLFDEAAVVVLGALFTICVRTADVLPAKFASPLYTAVIECAPPPSPAVVNVAVPPLNVPVPRLAPPFWKVIVPVGVPVADDMTVTVKVIAVPKEDGLFEEVTVVVLAALGNVTVCVRAGDLLPVKFASPA